MSIEPLEQCKEEANNISLKLNDMMKIMETTMETMFTYDTLYNEANSTYIILAYQQNDIENENSDIKRSIEEGKTLIDEAKGCILDSENNLQVPSLFFTTPFTMINFIIPSEYKMNFIFLVTGHSRHERKFTASYQ